MTNLRTACQKLDRLDATTLCSSCAALAGRIRDTVGRGGLPVRLPRIPEGVKCS